MTENFPGKPKKIAGPENPSYKHYNAFRGQSHKISAPTYTATSNNNQIDLTKEIENLQQILPHIEKSKLRQTFLKFNDQSRVIEYFLSSSSENVKTSNPTLKPQKSAQKTNRPSRPSRHTTFSLKELNAEQHRKWQEKTNNLGVKATKVKHRKSKHSIESKLQKKNDLKQLDAIHRKRFLLSNGPRTLSQINKNSEDSWKEPTIWYKDSKDPRDRVDPGNQRLIQIGKKCLALSNEFRKSQGLPLMKWNHQLWIVASQHAHQMAKGTMPFSHKGFDDRNRAVKYPHSSMRENIAYNNMNFDQVAKTAVDGWIQSPGHRKNLVGSNNIYCSIGVARKSDGTFYLTQLFTG